MKILYLGLDPSRYPHKGTLIHLPIIKILPFPFEEVQHYFKNLDSFTHVLFTSRTAATLYLNYAEKSNSSIRDKKYISLGKGTSEVVDKEYLLSDGVAQNESAEGVVALLETLRLEQSRIFFPHSLLARRVIHDYLLEKGIFFTAFPLYTTGVNEVEMPPLDEFDQIVFTSPSSVHAFIELTGKAPPKEKGIGIGSITTQVLSTLS